MISRKAPDLSGGACHRRHGGEKQEDEQNGTQDTGRRVRAGGLVDDLDDWIIRVLGKRISFFALMMTGKDVTHRVDKGINVLYAEAERDEHGDTHHPVEHDTPHHRLGQLNRGVFQLFTHVSSRIGAYETPDRARQTDETAETGARPSAAVVELSEDLIGRGMVGHNPEHDQEGEEGKDVCEEDDALRQW